MEHAEDVGRLFSWLKAPMVHYREFTPQIEVAEAVAAWPAVHRAAVETGLAPQNEPAPHGAGAARERIARERMALPTAVADAIQQAPLFDPVPTQAGQSEERPAGEGVMATRVERREAARVEPPPEPAAPPPPVTDRRPEAAPSAARYAEPTPPVRPEAPRPPPARHEPGALFSGEYREREREAPPRGRAADRQDRSLDAVFSRLSGGRDRLPDPRGRARTTPGLGGVFNRLR